MPTANDPFAQLGSLCKAVSQMAGVVAISRAVTPTHRRALAVARPLLEADGRLDLHERLLGAVGADRADEAQLADATSAAISAARMEAALGGSADMSEDFRALLPRFAAGGIADMVRAGMPREAMLPALASLSLSGAVVTGPATHRADARSTSLPPPPFASVRYTRSPGTIASQSFSAWPQDLAEVVPTAAEDGDHHD